MKNWTQQNIDSIEKSKSKSVAIGIDPDVDKSGVALKTKKQVKLLNLKFFDLMDFFNQVIEEHGLKEIIAYVECGYLNRGNWHKVFGTNSTNAQIGQRTGANHETAKKIVEMCEYLGIECVKIKPKSKKLNAKEFLQVTQINQRTNQEQRDAYMLIYRNFHI